MLQIKKFYSGKKVLITGCTGFLGKVILEKVLWSCPDINQVFVMVRAKRKTLPMDRVKFEILSSPCFKRLKQRHHGNDNFLKWAESKIVPVQGDLVIDRLGLSQHERALITENVDVIINSAASVNFDDPLHDALQINFFGCQRMLELAKECKNLAVFTQISTAYVNCNKKGYIDELIYESDQDIESLVRSIMAKNVKEVKDKE